VTDAVLLENKIGYLALTEGFDFTTAEEFEVAFNSLKRHGMQSLIVDLRGNGGGLMDQAILVAEKFLPFGQMIVSQRGRNAVEDREWRSRNRRPESMPLVFLVDEGTASASEILAAAMQDNDRAAVIGTRTFGKGLVQNVIPLDDGSGLTLTSERYYTPSGRSIQREYSDSGLYDYFRHTNHGALINRPEAATRTLKGRVVFGGDGIQPDEIVDSFELTTQRVALVDRLFNFLRVTSASETVNELFAKYCVRKDANTECESDPAFVRFHLAQFRKLRSETDNANIGEVLTFDPQMAAAMRTLTKKAVTKP
jgi:carboxyl-terminal processing protease